MAGTSPTGGAAGGAPAASPSVSAAVAAATDHADAVSSYKRKLFFRKLKAALMALTGITLLLLGCLLGFVLPASLEVKGQERGNLSSTENPISLNSTALPGNTSQSNVSASTPSNATTLASTETSNNSDGTTSSSLLLTILTTKSPTINTQVAKDRRPPKWWIPYIHDSMGGEKAKHPYPDEPTTFAPNASRNATSLSDGNSSSIIRAADSTPSNTIQKLWVVHYREHTENELQKKHNETTNSSMETARPNVRRVTSYPQQNITTTLPSVVTRHVRSVR